MDTLTKTDPAETAHSSSARTMLIGVGMFGLVAVLSGAPAPSPSPSTEPNTHTLFMGTDISLERAKVYHRVKDVVGDSFVITVKSEPVFVPVKATSLNLKIEQSLKMSGVSAMLKDLKGGPTYSPGNDPRMIRQREQMQVTAALDDAASLAMGQYVAAQNKFGTAINPDSGIMGAAQSAANLDAIADAAAKKAWSSGQAANTLAASDMTSGTFYQDKAKDDMALELFDAMEVSFEVSSEVPLNNPYVLVISRFHERNARPDTARSWIYAKSLEPIDGQPRKVTIRQSGFPRGFVLEDYRVHLYNRGQEVATNVSTKQVPLTREEAFDYLKIEYLSTHKSSTLPPTPAMAQMPADFHQRLSGGKLNQTLYVKVSKDGISEGAYLDESCSQKVEDPYVESVVKAVRFKPALEKGRPVDAVAPLKLGELGI
jgi:hypothetical protein